MEIDVLDYSLDPNQSLAFMKTNSPLLIGFYTLHIHHYPIRIKPDDIWLLIIQVFNNHINAKSQVIRKYFVGFYGKQKLTVVYPLSGIEEINWKVLEDISEQLNEQMKKYFYYYIALCDMVFLILY